MPRTNDARFDALADVYARASDGIADLVTEMLVTTSAKTRLRLYGDVLRRLRELDSSTASWVESYVAEIMREEEDRLGFLLLLDLSEKQKQDILQSAIQQSRQQILATLGLAVASIRAVAASAASGRSVSQLHSLVNAARQSSANVMSLRKELREKLITVRTVAGTTVRFEPSYYAALTAFMESAFAAQALTKQAMKEANRDLVMISPNPSTIGDFCDMYRGKVFSLSGLHPDVPPLSIVPSGNVPMHPWCHHRLLPYNDAGKTSGQLQQVSYMPAEFLAAAARGASANAIEKLWRSRAWRI